VRFERGAESVTGSSALAGGGRNTLLAVAAFALGAGMPTDAGAQLANGAGDAGPVDDWNVESRHERGYPAFRWGSSPAELVRDPQLSVGRGSASLPGGDGIELRAGAPFARVGKRLVVLANESYLADGDLWVPTELLTTLRSLRSDARTGLIVEIPRSSGEERTEGVTPRSGPWKITIDPGHGGHDPGTVNPRTGAREKDIVLAVSRKLARELRNRPGFQVELTREDDRFIPLKQRPKQARSSGSDLFISVHVNAEPGGGTSANGFETYFLAPARNDEASRVARLENSVLELEGEDPEFGNENQIDKIKAMVFRDDNRDVSQQFGSYLQNGLREIAVGKDRGTKPGPFWVLVGATGHMPAVLVELGFITNAKDVQKLTDGDYQERLAVALADSIEEYVESYVRAQIRLGGGG
jgi:N-acetylmuramoyl-L-alanine amidase